MYTGCRPALSSVQSFEHASVEESRYENPGHVPSQVVCSQESPVCGHLAPGAIADPARIRLVSVDGVLQSPALQPILRCHVRRCHSRHRFDPAIGR